MKKLTINFILGILFLNGFSQTTEELIFKADELVSAQRFKEAIGAYTESIKRDSTKIDIYYKRGVAYYYNEQDANAVIDYNKAISLGANSPDIYFMRAKSEAFLGNNNAALSDYARVIELDSNYVEAYVQRAYVFLTLKQMMPAFVFFTKAINKNPNQPADLYFARGYTYQETGAFQQALDDYAKAIELDAEFSEPYLNSGNCHYALKDYNKALEYYSLAEKLNPTNSTVYFARGFVFLDTGDTDKACQEWQKAVGMGNAYAQPYIDQHCGKKSFPGRFFIGFCWSIFFIRMQENLWS